MLVLVLGVVATLVGIAAVGFGLPNADSTVGNAAIIGGTTMLVGGLVLIGLAAAIGQLRRIADGLAVRGPVQLAGRGEMPETMLPQPAFPDRAPAMPEPAVAAEAGPVPARIPFPPRPSPRTPPHEPPMPEPYGEAPPPPPQRAPVDVSSNAIERLRSNIARAAQRPAEPSPPPVAPAPPPFVRQGRMPPPRGGNGTMTEEGEARRMLEPSPHEHGGGFEPEAPSYAEVPAAAEAGPAEHHARPPLFDSLWPPESRPVKQRAEPPSGPVPPMAPPRVGPGRHERAAEAAPEHPPQHPPHPASAQPGENAKAVAILKSGVVDGMAYTLYTDGSIEAQLPSGTVRFASIGELRAHLDQHSQS